VGLDVYLSSPGVSVNKYGTADDLDSARYPSHMFKRNYLRSSYNGAGFNSVVGNLLGRDLSWVFEPAMGDSDEYEFHPTKEQLLECRERAEQMVDDLAGAEQIGVEFYAGRQLRPDLGVIDSDADAIAAYRAEAKRDQPFGGGSYSNAVGHFLISTPLSVRAVIAGKGFIGDGVYLIFDRSDNEWYQQGAEIVVEFIDYALSQDAPEIRWSA